MEDKLDKILDGLTNFEMIELLYRGAKRLTLNNFSDGWESGYNYAINASILLGELSESKCPKCGNVDRLTEPETEKTVHCQRCYNHYEYKE